MTNLASTRAKNLTACLGLALFSLFTARVSAQTNYYNANGTEYPVIGALPGDQVFPDVAISPTGGFLVWQDNITDGDGWGISARRLDSTLSGTLGTFRVNATGAGDQENARVALLKNGGAVFVWQGGKPSHQRIFARFLTPSNTFLATTDLQVNAFNNNFQITPAVTVLNNSNVVVVWSSFNQAGSNSMQDVYAQILSPAGQKIGGEFLVNQQTAFNQRAPSVAAQPGGGFIVTWVSEQQRVLAPAWGTNSTAYVQAASIITPSIDIYSRLYNSSGTAFGNESLVNLDANPSTSPTVAVAADGSYLIAWAAHDQLIASNGFDIFGRTFSSAGSANGSVFRINSHLYGDQYTPRASAIGLDFLVSWTSLAQDGSREGVYAQFVHNDGSHTGAEFRVNTTTLSQQMHPTVASDGVNQFIVAWTSFAGLTNEFDLYAQRYVNASAVLQAMPAPYVWAPFGLNNNVYQPSLVVSWAPLLGLSISNYEVYLDGASTAYAKVTSNQWTMTATDGLTTKSSHSFQLDYVMTDGRRAPISPATTGTTWSGLNWGGIPYEWMAAYFGGYFNGNYTTNFWPAANGSLGQNMSLLQIFKSGGNPLDPTTWLKQQLVKTAQGLYLSWNTQPGATYQVQVSTNFKTWTNVGSPRFAAGATDSIFVGGSPVGYYQIVLMR